MVDRKTADYPSKMIRNLWVHLGYDILRLMHRRLISCILVVQDSEQILDSLLKTDDALALDLGRLTAKEGTHKISNCRKDSGNCPFV